MIVVGVAVGSDGMGAGFLADQAIGHVHLFQDGIGEFLPIELDPDPIDVRDDAPEAHPQDHRPDPPQLAPVLDIVRHGEGDLGGCPLGELLGQGLRPAGHPVHGGVPFLAGTNHIVLVGSGQQFRVGQQAQSVVFLGRPRPPGGGP